MTNEPLYAYEKGKGWVIVNNLVQLGNDLYTYEFRAPVFSERYIRLPKTGEHDPVRLHGITISTAHGDNYDYVFERYDLCVVTLVE